MASLENLRPPQTGSSKTCAFPLCLFLLLPLTTFIVLSSSLEPFYKSPSNPYLLHPSLHPARLFPSHLAPHLPWILGSLSSIRSSQGTQGPPKALEAEKRKKIYLERELDVLSTQMCIRDIQVATSCLLGHWPKI